MSLAYDGERADGRMLDQLESVLRYVADELAGWRARAVKAEAELKEGGARSGGAVAKSDPETRGRVADLEQENRTLRQRVDAARGRIVATDRAGILAALDITNELCQTKKGEREVAGRLAALADDMTKLLPPGKRKALSHQPSAIS